MPLSEADTKKINSLIVDELGCDDSEVTADAKLIDDLGADSLDIVDLGMRLEEEFEIEEIPVEDIEKWSSVSDLYDYIEKRTS